MSATIKQVRDWHRRLADICCEMEEAYGEPGANYPPPLNMAVYLACQQAQMARAALTESDAFAFTTTRGEDER